jgi:hypothetical protein
VRVIRFCAAVGGKDVPHRRVTSRIDQASLARQAMERSMQDAIAACQAIHQVFISELIAMNM